MLAESAILTIICDEINLMNLASNFFSIKTLGLAMLLCAIGSPALAEVLPAPEHPGHHNIAANSAEEHAAAASHHKDTAEYYHALGLHHASLAREHAKLGHHKLAEHHEKLAKLYEAIAEEHAATAKTHEHHPVDK